MSVSVTYRIHDTAACILMRSIIHLKLPSIPYHPFHPLPTYPPFICAARDITVAVKIFIENPAVLATYLAEIVIKH